MPKRAKRPTFKPSPEYSKLLAFINETPRLLSMLYDMNLLPEQVSDHDTMTTRRAMMTAVIAYKVGADAWKDQQASIDRLSHG